MTTAIAATTVVGTTIDAIRPQAAFALDNGLARTPPMGFNDWNAFRLLGGRGADHADRRLLRHQRSRRRRLPVCEHRRLLDDPPARRRREARTRSCEVPARDGLAGRLRARQGAQAGHLRGCRHGDLRRFPGSLGHEAVDAQSFADWGIDYLKYDNCNNAGSSTKEEYIARYSAMRDALAQTGRQIVYSICEWGVNEPWTWAPRWGNLWRTTGDISDSWSSLKSISSAERRPASVREARRWNRPGHAGGRQRRHERHRVPDPLRHLAMLAAPLLIGTDLRRASAATLDILLNSELIAIDQDALGVQAKRSRATPAGSCSPGR